MGTVYSVDQETVLFSTASLHPLRLLGNSFRCNVAGYQVDHFFKNIKNRNKQSWCLTIRCQLLRPDI